MAKQTKVLIVGGGPAGLSLAIELLHRPNYHVCLIERRPDPLLQQQQEKQATRTFPIALQSRGLNALSSSVVSKLTSTIGVYCVGVCLHKESKKPTTRVIPKDPPNLSVDRNQLVALLRSTLNECERHASTQFDAYFETTVQTMDLPNQRLTLLDTKDKETTMSFDYLVAADGGRSIVRQVLVGQKLVECTIKDIPDDYRTIHLARNADVKDNSSLQNLDGDKLHGWMFSKPQAIKIIAAPIHPKLVSGAIVFDKGQDPFENMKTPEDVMDFFFTLAPNSLAPYMTLELAGMLLNNPTATLVSVRCQQLHVLPSGGRDCGGVLLLGDAAHAVSASAGQGCNAALQDVQVFCQVLDECKDDWAAALPAYTKARIADAHAVSEISDYCMPHTTWMKVEWMLRTILRSLLPISVSKWLLRPMPMDVLSETSLDYATVLEQTRWWIDRVKQTHKQP